MSISVQQLVQTAFQNCSLIGDGESVDGTMAGTTANDGALGLLNNLLAELNSQGFISQSNSYMTFTWIEGCRFVGGSWSPSQQGPIPPNFILGPVPDKLTGVSRKIGDRWIPLHSCDKQQMMSRTRKSLATSWCYELVDGFNQSAGGYMAWGALTLDTTRPTEIRTFYNEKIKATSLVAPLFLNDMYFDLLLNGLCVKLCVKYKLTDYLPIFEQQFKQAKNLIKRSNATQRMLQRGDLGGGYDDSFYNGLGGVGW